MVKFKQKSKKAQMGLTISILFLFIVIIAIQQLLEDNTAQHDAIILYGRTVSGAAEFKCLEFCYPSDYYFAAGAFGNSQCLCRDGRQK